MMKFFLLLFITFALNLVASPHSIRIDDLIFITDSEKPHLSSGKAVAFPYSDEASVLLEKALEIKKIRGNKFDLVIDSFCGDGKSGLPIVFHLSPRSFIASDINPRAIEYARINAEINHLESKSHFSIRNILKDGDVNPIALGILYGLPIPLFL